MEAYPSSNSRTAIVVKCTYYDAIKAQLITVYNFWLSYSILSLSLCTPIFAFFARLCSFIVVAVARFYGIIIMSI